MFFKLRKQARIRAQSTGTDTRRHIQGISKTFLLIVFAFFTLLLPFSITRTIAGKFKDFGNIILVQAWDFSIVLANFNSCINPVIYAKIHRKIYLQTKNLIARVLRHFRGCFDKQRRDTSGSTDSNRNNSSVAKTKYSNGIDQKNGIEMSEIGNSNANRNDRPAKSDQDDQDLPIFPTCIDAEVVEETNLNTLSFTSSHVDSTEMRSDAVANTFESTGRDVEKSHITCNLKNHGYEPDEMDMTFL